MTITLKTLHQATAQEVFDQVKNHLLTQMKKSQKGFETVCLYRNSGGLKCAAGCLIADDEYKLSPFEKIGDWNALVAEGCVPTAHSKLIYSLQALHDFSTPGDWAARLQEVAYEYGLNYGD